MLRWVLAVLLLIPLVDIMVLVIVAGRIGVVATVAIVVLTALIGLMLVRSEGRHTVRNLHHKLARGEAPTNEVLDGGLLIAAGAFLLTPGLVTDAIGFLLVIPPTRYVIRGALKRWIVLPALDRKTGGFVTGNVYTFGFPDGGSNDAASDLGPEAYDVDIEENPDDGSGKRNP